MIRILQQYVLRETLQSFIICFIVLVAVMLLGMSFQMLYSGLNVLDLRRLIPYLLLYTFPFALPVALLIATIMVYGRMSGDHEITAVRTSGLHLHVIFSPVIFVGLLTSVISGYLNASLLPAASCKIRELQREAMQALLNNYIGSAQQHWSFPKHEIFVGQSNGQKFKDILIFETAYNCITRIIVAKQGYLTIDEDAQIAEFHLENGNTGQLTYGSPGKMKEVAFKQLAVKFPLPGRYAATRSEMKYASLFALLRKRRVMVGQLRAYPKLFKDPEEAQKIHAQRRNDLDAKFNQFAAERRKVREDLKNTEIRLKKQKDALKRKAEQRDELARERTTIKDRKASLGKQIKADVAQIEVLRKKRQTISKKSKVESKHIDEQIAALTKRLALNRQDLRETEKTLAAIESKLDGVLQELALLDKDVQILQKSQQALQDRDVMLTQKLNSIRVERAEEEALRRRAEIQAQKHYIDTEVQQRLAGAVSSLAFVIIGIPLGIMTRRGNVLAAFVIGLALVFVIYYPLFTVGDILTRQRIVSPIIASWTPNAFMMLIGGLLFRRILKQ